MPSFPTLRFSTMRACLSCIALPAITLQVILSANGAAADNPAAPLPFAPEQISRLSLDGKPRSLAIRQGADVWLGYDLQRAALLKVWQAPPGKPGLARSGFTTRSAGVTLFEDASEAGWELARDRSTIPLAVRYLGCSHRPDHVELRWELRHDADTLRLFERIPLSAAAEEAASKRAGDVGRAVRELRVEGLRRGDSLLPPATARKTWKLVDGAADRKTEPVAAPPALGDDHWHRLTLP